MEPVIHTIRYFGNFEQGFSKLTPATSTYFDRHGVEKPIGRCSEKVDGLQFRYMEKKSKAFVAVGVERIVLHKEVPLVEERHTDGKGFFSDPHFGDASALRLLKDMIASNPELKEDLERLARDVRATAEQ